MDREQPGPSGHFHSDLRFFWRDGGICVGPIPVSGTGADFYGVSCFPHDAGRGVRHPDVVGVYQSGLGEHLPSLDTSHNRQCVLGLHFRQFFLQFPKELIEAAKLDGAGPFRLFILIALPLARAPMIAAAVIIFTLNWNNFLWPLLVVFDESMKTLPVGIAAFAPVVGTHTQLEGYSVAMAGVTVLSIPSLTLFFILQKYFIQGISQGSLSQ